MSLELIVTLRAAGSLGQSQIWDTRRPLAIGHPFRWVLERTEGGILARALPQPGQAPMPLSVAKVPAAQLRSGARIALGDRFTLQLQQTRAFTGAVKGAPTLSLADTTDRSFRGSLRLALSGFAAFVFLSLIWPAPRKDEAELIPPQVAKIVLQPRAPKAQAVAQASPAPAAAGASSQSAPKSVAEAAAQSAPKAVQKSAVVQAFRAHALQNSIKGLLRGGMTRLMQQSDIVAGAAGTTQARQMLGARSNALQATTTAEIGSIRGKSTQVAALGGAAGGTGGVGYGKGGAAGVSGQGQAYVSIDSPLAQVEEGLTREEVGEVIHKHLSEIRYCYESAMVRKAAVEGKLLMNFVIGGTGLVKTADIAQSSLSDPRLDDCVLRRLKTWKFPNPKGGVDVAVSYPFLFKTLGQ